MTETMTDNENLDAIERMLQELKKDVHRMKTGRWKNLRDKTIRAAHAIRKHTRTGLEKSRKQISHHPLTYTSSSFAAGAVIGTAVTWLLLRDG